MRLLGWPWLVIAALLIFLAGVAFQWWTPDGTGIGVAYLVAGIYVALGVLDNVTYQRRQTPPEV